MVGGDTSKSVGWWKAKSEVMTPSAITEPWSVGDGSAWVEVPAAKIIKATAAVKAALAAAEAKAASMEPVVEPVVGDAVECIAFNNIVRNWKTGVVTDKRITQGAQTSQGEGEVCLKCICNIFTCFMFKSSCCPDVYVYSMKYGDGRVETGVPAERVRKTHPHAQQPLAATQVELAVTQAP
jgi:hypothetical protein